MQLVVCNGLNLEFQLTGKCDKNRSIGDILGVETLYVLDKYVSVILSRYNHIDTEKNRVQVVPLPVITAKSHVTANKQFVIFNLYLV